MSQVLVSFFKLNKLINSINLKNRHLIKSSSDQINKKADMNVKHEWTETGGKHQRRPFILMKPFQRISNPKNEEKLREFSVQLRHDTHYRNSSPLG